MAERLREKAVILLSAGLDSTVSLALGEKRYEIVKALFFDYGQAAAGREKDASSRIAERYAIELEVVKIPWLGVLSSSSLIEKAEAAQKVEKAAQKAGAAAGPTEAPASWVENRNGIFLNIAAAFAVSLNGTVVLAGFNAEEAADFPDNSSEYIEAVNRSLETGEVHEVRVESPTIDMDKRNIVAEGLRLGVPFELIWSCYRGGSRMCGVCPSCRRLRSALDAGGAADKVIFSGE